MWPYIRDLRLAQFATSKQPSCGVLTILDHRSLMQANTELPEFLPSVSVMKIPCKVWYCTVHGVEISGTADGRACTTHTEISKQQVRLNSRYHTPLHQTDSNWLFQDTNTISTIYNFTHTDSILPTTDSNYLQACFNLLCTCSEYSAVPSPMCGNWLEYNLRCTPWILFTSKSSSSSPRALHFVAAVGDSTDVSSYFARPWLECHLQQTTWAPCPAKPLQNCLVLGVPISSTLGYTSCWPNGTHYFGVAFFGILRCSYNHNHNNRCPSPWHPHLFWPHKLSSCTWAFHPAMADSFIAK